MSLQTRGAPPGTLYCPACAAVLSFGGEALCCTTCGRAYPVIDGIPSFVADRARGDVFPPEVFGLMEYAEDHHCWFLHRREAVVDVLRREVGDLSGKRMLDIGCGSGKMLRYLQETTGLALAGADLQRDVLERCRRNVDVPLYQTDATRLPFRGAFDIIGVFDTLEHIEDDVRALRACRDGLAPRGWLIATVPAYAGLRTSFDDFVGHRRRYTRGELVRKLAGAGFAVKRATYYMVTLLPAVYLSRTLQNRFGLARGTDCDRFGRELRVIPVANTLLLGVLRAERWFMRYVDWPVGPSLLVLARRT
jgi:SAM-dependent methyltransferase/uncharacterized protein YbaR (Trm112 family)